MCVGEIDTQAFGMHTVKVPKEFYAGQEQTFVDAILGKKVPYFPDLTEAIEFKKILDAVQLSSDKRAWVNVEDVR